MEKTPKKIANLIPQLGEATVAFPAGKGIEDVYDILTPIALSWAEENPGSWGLEFFSQLFFKGGVIPIHKELEGIEKEDTFRILQWIRAAMFSYYPKHEDKEAVCGMLWAMFFKEPSLSN